MKRAGRYFLLTCFVFAAVYPGTKLWGEPRAASPAFASPHLDGDIEKYNRKLQELEVRRGRDHQKLDADYLKLFQRKKTVDLRKLQHEIDKFQRKRDKIEKKYRQEMEKLERERFKKGS